ncbi:DUF7119 family protein [Halorarum salinum]|uniref:DUF7119 domain-containing protein n=1 Tax=Halorarum salinum TaxID=2743089 RepID=A0A7D5LA19_9EURY|nr:hypothetical protein [Halobaculum salinum]QLG61215.1 hypothetical protein HUG12_05485 [Halobaculum salinum]
MSEEPPADREAAVGAPVVRGDPAVTGERADTAVGFDPSDGASLAEAAETVARFATDEVGDDNVLMLRGAAACAALVRGEGSYKAAAERASGTAAAGDAEVPISFIRKWARVHDLPQAIRRHVARGELAPTAAKHIARTSGEARLALAWAALDADLTVREIRSLASAVNEGTPVGVALRDEAVPLGRIELDLPFEAYSELRVRASLENRDPGEVVAEALTDHFSD